jgi:hypothetical protein
VFDNSLINFMKSNPFWAIFIIVFMVLPIIGAVVHILLKAFGRRGLDNTLPEPNDETDDTNGTPKTDEEPDPDKSQNAH